MGQSRREFLADVGRGMLIASVGSSLAVDLGLAPAFAADAGPASLSFGDLEPLVCLMQETPADKLMPKLVERIGRDNLGKENELKTLVAAAALANARTFGGQDYIGFHTLMALVPAYEMALTQPEPRRALPVFKVLYRNTNRIQGKGARKHEVLHEVAAGKLPEGKDSGELMQAATRAGDMNEAERTFAAIAQKSSSEAFNAIQHAIQDEMNVHRVVLSWRAWALLPLTGEKQAHTLLRQSVRFCIDEEQRIKSQKRTPEIRVVLPKLLSTLEGKPIGDKQGDDAWIERLSQTIYASSRAQAAEAVASALAEGFAPEVIGEAISLAANRLVLCDRGRGNDENTAGTDFKKVRGSCHGDSVGVHASDSANAWRNIARVSNKRNTFASLIAGAFHTAGQAGGQIKQLYPLAEDQEKVQEKDPAKLLSACEAAIRERNQPGASALIHRYGTLGHDARPAFDLLLRFAISEDGALHAEKYYRTVMEEFARTRPAFRWRQLVALARVTASEYGQPAPGYAETCELLKV